MTIKSGLGKVVGLALVVTGAIMVVIFTALADCRCHYPAWLKIMLIISYALLILGILLLVAGGIAGTRKKYIAQEDY